MKNPDIFKAVVLLREASDLLIDRNPELGHKVELVRRTLWDRLTKEEQEQVILRAGVDHAQL